MSDRIALSMPRPDAGLEHLEPWLAARLRPLSAGWEAGLRSGAPAGDDATLPEAFVHAAVLAGLVARDDGWNVILIRRADSLTRHAGQIALPGGRAEAGEAPLDTALRETHEEIGLEPRFVRPVGLGDAYRTRTGFEITPVVAFVEPGFVIAPAEAEVAEVFETPFAFVMDAANHQRRTWDGPDGERRRYYAIVHGERTIWGATAGMLRGLYARLFAPDADERGGAQPT